MSIFTSIEGDFDRFWANHMKPFLHDDVEPILKAFIRQFDSQFGKQAITAALEAVPEVATVGFAPTAVSLATTLYKDAVADAQTDAALTATQVLQTIQSALQVAKAVNGIVTPADQTAAASLTQPSAPAA